MVEKRPTNPVAPKLSIKKRREIQNEPYVKVPPPNHAKCDGFEPLSETKDGIIVSQWNVNGLRSILSSKKTACKCEPCPLKCYLAREKPDIMFLFETRMSEGVDYDASVDGYIYIPYTSGRKGYAGTCIYIKESWVKARGIKDVNEHVIRGIGHSTEPAEARVITFRLKGVITLIGAYAINSKRGLLRLDERMDYDQTMRKYLAKVVDTDKWPVLLLGDLNVAPKAIDVWDSLNNQKSAGHSVEERSSFVDTLRTLNCIDVYRELNPNVQKFSFWPSMGGEKALEENRGWRLDHVLMRKSDAENVLDMEIRDVVRGSDHCPVVIRVKIEEAKADQSRSGVELPITCNDEDGVRGEGSEAQPDVSNVVSDEPRRPVTPLHRENTAQNHIGDGCMKVHESEIKEYDKDANVDSRDRIEDLGGLTSTKTGTSIPATYADTIPANIPADEQVYKSNRNIYISKTGGGEHIESTYVTAGGIRPAEPSSFRDYKTTAVCTRLSSVGEEIPTAHDGGRSITDERVVGIYSGSTGEGLSFPLMEKGTYRRTLEVVPKDTNGVATERQVMPEVTINTPIFKGMPELDENEDNWRSSKTEAQSLSYPSPSELTVRQIPN